MRALSVLILILSLLLSGCKGSDQAESKQAVQRAVEAYLQERKNLMLSNMNMEVGEVKFEADKATAEVKFTSKQSSNLSVSVRYNLKRVGEGWRVESSAGMSGAQGSPHGSVSPSETTPDHDDVPLDSSH